MKLPVMPPVSTSPADGVETDRWISMETVDLPVLPPIDPMLAKAQAKVPPEAGVWSYEPKWDGRVH